MPFHVAIVGAGPAGFYTAEALLAALPGVEIDFIERLPTPYGLVRAGVAPDHQSTKQVTRRFEQTALQPSIAYFGNVEVGRDLDLKELRDLYDAVVLAVGSPGDRYMGIPGEDKRGVYGSALFVGWYNGHPDFRELDPDLETSRVAVVGHGNVALDVARVLVKTPDEMANSDIPSYAAAKIGASPITDVVMLGRRGPLEARFTNVELREMGRLADAVPVVDPVDLPADTPEHPRHRAGRVAAKNVATLREFARQGAEDISGKRKRVHFRFCSAPVEMIGGDRVEGLRVERMRVDQGRAVGTQEYDIIPCGLVVTAIGYQASPFPGVPFDKENGIIINDGGRVGPRLYVVGWAKRGPFGVIASNRPDGVTCAEQIAADLDAGVSEQAGRRGLVRLLSDRHVRVVTFADWRRIDAAEIAAGKGHAPRRKFESLSEMLDVVTREPIHS